MSLFPMLSIIKKKKKKTDCSSVIFFSCVCVCVFNRLACLLAEHACLHFFSSLKLTSLFTFFFFCLFALSSQTLLLLFFLKSQSTPSSSVRCARCVFISVKFVSFSFFLRLVRAKRIYICILLFFFFLHAVRHTHLRILCPIALTLLYQA